MDRGRSFEQFPVVQLRSAGQRSAAINGPDNAMRFYHSDDVATAHGFKSRFPWAEGEGIFTSDDGNASAGSGDGVVIDARYALAGLCRNEGGLQTVREILHDPVGFGLPQRPHHVAFGLNCVG